MNTDGNRAYWMLADTELPMARDARLIKSFEAHFKHGLLFNSKLMISDAQAVNCVNLRSLVHKESQFKELIGSGLLSIAVRATQDNPGGSRLTEVRDAFYQEKKQNMGLNIFLNDIDLEFLNENCEMVPYTYEALRENYTQGIFSIFEGDTARKLFGAEVQKLLVERLLREENRDDGLGRVFLHKNFEEDLKQIGKHGVWSRYKDIIIRLSDAPYVTGIPQVLNSNPIYSPLHQESFQLAYPQKSDRVEKGDLIDISTDLDLSTYEYALSKLGTEDILFIRDSFEFNEYQKYISLGVSTSSQLENAQDCLISYQTLIDQYIIKKNLGIKVSKQFRGKRYIEPIKRFVQEGGVFTLGLAITDIAAGGALSWANFFVGEFVGRKEKLTQARYEREKRKLILEMKGVSNEKKIEAKKSVKPDVNETIYSSVSKF